MFFLFKKILSQHDKCIVMLLSIFLCILCFLLLLQEEKHVDETQSSKLKTLEAEVTHWQQVQQQLQQEKQQQLLKQEQVKHQITTLRQQLEQK